MKNYVKKGFKLNVEKTKIGVICTFLAVAGCLAALCSCSFLYDSMKMRDGQILVLVGATGTIEVSTKILYSPDCTFGESPKTWGYAEKDNSGSPIFYLPMTLLDSEDSLRPEDAQSVCIRSDRAGKNQWVINNETLRHLERTTFENLKLVKKTGEIGVWRLPPLDSLD